MTEYISIILCGIIWLFHEEIITFVVKQLGSFKINLEWDSYLRTKNSKALEEKEYQRIRKALIENIAERRKANVSTDHFWAGSGNLSPLYEKKLTKEINSAGYSVTRERGNWYLTREEVKK